jgi:hypothetical protein
MPDDGPVDFRKWLCVELERERMQIASTSASCSSPNAVYLSELEATAMLFLALDIQNHAGGDRLTGALARGLADALYSRLLKTVEAAGSAVNSSKIETSDNHRRD